MKQSFKKSLLLLGSVVLCLTIPACGGGGGGGGGESGEAPATESSTVLSLIPEQYSQTTIQISGDHLWNAYYHCTRSGQNNGTVVVEGTIHLTNNELGYKKITVSTPGTWRQTSSSPDNIVLDMDLVEDKTGTPIRIRDMKFTLKEPATQTGSSIHSVIRGGSVTYGEHAIYNNTLEAFIELIYK